MLRCISFTWYRFDENSQSMEQGFPRLIVDDFPGVGPKVDAVFQEFGKKAPTSSPVGTLWGILWNRNDVDSQSSNHSVLYPLFSKFLKILTFSLHLFFLDTFQVSVSYLHIKWKGASSHRSQYSSGHYLVKKTQASMSQVTDGRLPFSSLPSHPRGPCVACVEVCSCLHWVIHL